MDLDLDKIQLAAQTQFSKRSESYGKNHILQNVDDVADALQSIPLRRARRRLMLRQARVIPAFFSRCLDMT
jgi:hypothetical protein